jgi:queuine/archaeosine tRNA-ribosyltransferase
MCGIIVGRNHEHRRQYSTTEMSKWLVQAVLISDLDACEEDEERSKLTEAALSEVTMSKIPLFITGVSRPLQILGAVAGRPAASPHHPVISTPMMTKVARLPLLP